MTLETENELLHKQKHATTLEELEDTQEDAETRQTLSNAQRLAIYRFLTARAYRLNKDTLRESALWTRNDLMQATKSKENIIPFDREVKLKKPSDFLPKILKDDFVST